MDQSIDNLEQKFISLGNSIRKHDNRDNWKDHWNFNLVAESYDMLISCSDSKPYFYENYDKLLDMVLEISTQGKNKNIKILDIGVGTGNLSGRFIDNGYSVVGLDQSVEMLIKAKNNFPAITIKPGNFLDLPMPDSSLDLVVSTYSFHHLNTDEKLESIREIFRTLKSNGELYIGDIMYESENVIQEISSEAEYYTNINEFTSVLSANQLTFQTFKVDDYLFILKITRDI